MKFVLITLILLSLNLNHERVSATSEIQQVFEKAKNLLNEYKKHLLQLNTEMVTRVNAVLKQNMPPSSVLSMTKRVEKTFSSIVAAVRKDYKLLNNNAYETMKKIFSQTSNQLNNLNQLVNELSQSIMQRKDYWAVRYTSEFEFIFSYRQDNKADTNENKTMSLQGVVSTINNIASNYKAYLFNYGEQLSVRFMQSLGNIPPASAENLVNKLKNVQLVIKETISNDLTHRKDKFLSNVQNLFQNNFNGQVTEEMLFKDITQILNSVKNFWEKEWNKKIELFKLNIQDLLNNVNDASAVTLKPIDLSMIPFNLRNVFIAQLEKLKDIGAKAKQIISAMLKTYKPNLNSIPKILHESFKEKIQSILEQLDKVTISEIDKHITNGIDTLNKIWQNPENGVNMQRFETLCYYLDKSISILIGNINVEDILQKTV